MMIQHTASTSPNETWGGSGDKYFEDERVSGAYFSDSYTNMGKCFSEVIKQTRREEKILKW